VVPLCSTQMLLCRLQLWNRKVDTKCLMAWNDSLVVLSFRGTASMRNVLADVKVPADQRLYAGRTHSFPLFPYVCTPTAQPHSAHNAWRHVSMTQCHGRGSQDAALDMVAIFVNMCLLLRVARRRPALSIPRLASMQHTKVTFAMSI
jgi:hypothetical protein